MKMLSFFLFVLLTTINGYSQDIQKLILTKDGIAPIIIHMEGYSADSLYKKAISWVKETYKNPKEVLKSEIENEKIRINGVKQNAYFYKTMGIRTDFDIEYEMSVDFKNEKLRVSYDILNVYFSSGKDAFPYHSYFNENGEIRKANKDVKPSMEETMNSLVLSFVNYIKSKKEDW